MYFLHSLRQSEKIKQLILHFSKAFRDTNIKISLNVKLPKFEQALYKNQGHYYQKGKFCQKGPKLQMGMKIIFL